MAKHFQSVHAATHRIGQRLNFAFWEKRAADMVLHFSEYRTSDGSLGHSNIQVMRVSKNWPRSGAIIVTREVDNQTAKLVMVKDRFKIVTI